MQNEYDSAQKPVLIQVCKRCKATKPLAEFRYQLTRAQMKAQGYAGNVLVTAEGKVCKECRPKRKPLTRMTIAELKAKSMTGDVHPMIAQARIKQKREDANALRKRARIERWHEVWAEQWEGVLQPLRDHLRKTGQVKLLAIKTGRKSKAKFLEIYTQALRKELASLTLHYKTQRRPPTYARWEEYIPPEVQMDLKRAWEEMPLDERVRMNTVPLMVKYRYDPQANIYKKAHLDSLASRRKALSKADNALADVPRLAPIPRGAEPRLVPENRLQPEKEKEVDTQSVGDWSDM